MDRTAHSDDAADRSRSSGHTLVELMLVLGLLAICTAGGVACLLSGLGAQEARGAAQGWQAAAAWGQLGVIWHGGSTDVEYGDGVLAVSHDLALCGASLGMSAPVAAASANVARWETGEGITVRFGGRLASPDGGGSVFFDSGLDRYRVVVRPESGLTARSRFTIE